MQSVNFLHTDFLPNLIDDVRDHAQQGLEWEKQAQDIPTWVENNRYILGEPWSYEAIGGKVEWGEYDIPHEKMPRPYLLQFVRDQIATKSICKCRQSEFTENHINEELYYCMSRPYTRISHLFASNEMSDAISNEKVSPAISDSPKIDDSVNSRAVRRYAFNNGSILTVTGVLQRAGGRAASRDILIFDEVDEMPESIFGVYEQLLSHSQMRYTRKISTPTIPQVGIDAVVRSGCEYEWVITCPKCKRKQTFTFPENIINYFEQSDYDTDDPKYQKRINKTYIGCMYCKEYIDRSSKWYAETSEWVPKRPNLVGEHHSYYVVAPMIPWKTGKALSKLAHHYRDYPHQFMNEEMGLAYMKVDQRLGQHEILKCSRPWSMVSSRIAALYNISVGVDFGLHSSWLVAIASGMEASQPFKKAVVYAEEINKETLAQNGFTDTSTTEHVKRVKQIVDLFGADIVVSDIGGLGLDRVTYLNKWFPTRSWGCEFDTAEEGRQIRKSPLFRPQFNKAQRKVRVSKVNMWKEVIGEFRRESLYIPKIDCEVMKKLIKHLTALGIQPRWSDTYEKEFEICVRMSKDDHLACSVLYALTGWNELVKYKYGGQSPGVA